MTANPAELLSTAKALRPSLSVGLHQVFSAETSHLRTRFRTLCEEILQTDLEYAVAMDVEKLLWRHAFYEVIAEYRKQHDKSTDFCKPNEAALASFLTEATGFYFNLVIFLLAAHNVDAMGIVELALAPESVAACGTLSGDRSSQHLAKLVCHRCLVSLGDVARYASMLLNDSSAVVSAYRYYRQAAMLVPDLGVPFNQLAVLFRSQPAKKIETLYYSLRCLGSKESFENTDKNMQSFLAKNRMEGSVVHRIASVEIMWLQRQMVYQRFVGHLLLLHESLHGASKKQPLEAISNSLLCDFEHLLLITDHGIQQGVVTDFQQRMEPWDCLTPTLLLQIFAINIFAVQRCLLQAQSDHVSVYTALNMFASFLNWLMQLFRLLTVVDGVPLAAHYMSSAKIFLDWLVTEPIMTRLHRSKDTPSVRTLWTALCGFYNILLQGHGLEAFRASRSEVKQVAALPEDVELWGFLPFRDSHFGLDFSWKVVSQQHEARMAALFLLAQRLSDHVCSGMRFSSEGGVFLCGSSSADAPLTERGATQLAPAVSLEKREEVMKAMARSRLQMEVAQLQSQVSKEGSRLSSIVSPLVIPDAVTFARNLAVVKELIETDNLIVVVAKTVITGLDELKVGGDRTSKGARDAIKYLDELLREKRAKVHAQQPHEVMRIEPNATITHDNMGLLQCAMYFAQEVPAADLVTVLTTNTELMAQAKLCGVQTKASGDFLHASKALSRKRGNKK